MLFFYIRHGDPIYSPDSLTPLGERQAQALSKRLAVYGLDKVYSSTSNRAILTAKPTCELIKKDMELLDFANEGHAWRELGVDYEVDGKKVHNWLVDKPGMKKFFCSEEIISLGQRWYDHPAFEGYDYKKGIDRIRTNADELFASLGYEHIPGTGTYKAVRPNKDRVALFAHHGFGIAFFSCIFDIPYPLYASHFGLCHSSMTVINFPDSGDGISIPTVLTFSNDSHIYAEGLPTNYNNVLRF